MKNLNFDFLKCSKEELERLAKIMVKDVNPIPNIQNTNLAREAVKSNDILDIDFSKCSEEEFKELAKIALGLEK